jgi:hypothetical protein
VKERRTLTSMYDRGDGEITNEDLLARMAEDDASGAWPPDEQRRRRYVFDEGADRYERWLDRCLEGG